MDTTHHCLSTLSALYAHCKAHTHLPAPSTDSLTHLTDVPQSLQLVESALAPGAEVAPNPLQHGTEADICVRLPLHDKQNGAEDIGHSLRVRDAIVLQSVDHNDVDQFLDVVFRFALREVHLGPGVALGGRAAAVGVERLGWVRPHSVPTNCLVETAHLSVADAIYPMPLPCVCVCVCVCACVCVCVRQREK